MTDRLCIGCRQVKNRNEMIKITNSDGNIVINPNSLTFGRSVYLCYNKTCIENALKKNNIEKFLKHSISEELKGQLLNEL